LLHPRILPSKATKHLLWMVWQPNKAGSQPWFSSSMATLGKHLFTRYGHEFSGAVLDDQMVWKLPDLSCASQYLSLNWWAKASCTSVSTRARFQFKFLCESGYQNDPNDHFSTTASNFNDHMSAPFYFAFWLAFHQLNPLKLFQGLNSSRTIRKDFLPQLHGRSASRAPRKPSTDCLNLKVIEFKDIFYF